MSSILFASRRSVLCRCWWRSFRGFSGDMFVNHSWLNAHVFIRLISLFSYKTPKDRWIHIVFHSFRSLSIFTCYHDCVAFNIQTHTHTVSVTRHLFHREKKKPTPCLSFHFYDFTLLFCICIVCVCVFNRWRLFASFELVEEKLWLYRRRSLPFKHSLCMAAINPYNRPEDEDNMNGQICKCVIWA